MGAMASVAALTSASDEDVHKFIAAALQNDRAGALRVIKTAAAIAKLEVSVLNGADGNALPEGVQLTSPRTQRLEPNRTRRLLRTWAQELNFCCSRVGAALG